MGVNDRDWARGPHKQPMNIAKILVFINVAIFAVSFSTMRATPLGTTSPLFENAAYSATGMFENGQIWRIITYQFLHGNIGHILFNMICLWFFGISVAQIMGNVRFLLFYLVCGIVAALTSTGLYATGVLQPHPLIPWQEMEMIGASGSIYGVIAAASFLFPYARVQLLFPPINLSVRQFSWFILVIATVFILFDWDNAGGEAGHLGGILCGFFLMQSRRLWWR